MKKTLLYVYTNTHSQQHYYGLSCKDTLMCSNWFDMLKRVLEDDMLDLRQAGLSKMSKRLQSINQEFVLQKNDCIVLHALDSFWQNKLQLVTPNSTIKALLGDKVNRIFEGTHRISDLCTILLANSPDKRSKHLLDMAAAKPTRTKQRQVDEYFSKHGLLQTEKLNHTSWCKFADLPMHLVREVRVAEFALEDAQHLHALLKQACSHQVQKRYRFKKEAQSAASAQSQDEKQVGCVLTDRKRGKQLCVSKQSQYSDTSSGMIRAQNQKNLCVEKRPYGTDVKGVAFTKNYKKHGGHASNTKMIPRHKRKHNLRTALAADIQDDIDFMFDNQAQDEAEAKAQFPKKLFEVRKQVELKVFSKAGSWAHFAPKPSGMILPCLSCQQLDQNVFDEGGSCERCASILNEMYLEILSCEQLEQLVSYESLVKSIVRDIVTDLPRNYEAQRQLVRRVFSELSDCHESYQCSDRCRAEVGRCLSDSCVREVDDVRNEVVENTVCRHATNIANNCDVSSSTEL